MNWSHQASNVNGKEEEVYSTSIFIFIFPPLVFSLACILNKHVQILSSVIQITGHNAVIWLTILKYLCFA